VPSDVMNLADKLGRFSELWSPRVVAEVNDYQVKLDREQIMAVVNRLLPQKPKKSRSRGRKAAAETASQCVSV